MTTSAPARPPAPAPSPARRPALRRALAALRNLWRWLTAMRTAIVILFLLALASIPGSLLPQRSISRSQVGGFFEEYPDLAPVLDRLYLFDVFSSPWFTAVYVLLFVSLVGCVVPRAVEHARALRTPPPPAPRHLQRLPHSAAVRTALPASPALDVVEEELRVRRFRVVRREREGRLELSAEKGYLKEAGNLLLHLSLLGLLLGIAGGKLWAYEGSILVTEGQGFCNSFQEYDSYRSGPLVDAAALEPLCVDLEGFQAEYEPDLTASSSAADVRYGPPGEEGATRTIGVNDPLRLDGTRLYVTGHGFSPTFSVALPDGSESEDITVPFLPQDSVTFGSQGAVTLPDLGRSDGQLALEGFFAPSGVVQDGVLSSIDPRPLAPQVALVAYQGYLGPGSGLPQSVFSIDRSLIDSGQLVEVGSGNLRVGESLELDDGTTVTFSGFREFAALQVSHDPGQLWVLAASVLLMLGLLGTLLLRRERVFVRAGPGEDDGGTVLTTALLTRGGGDPARRSAELSGELHSWLAGRSAGPDLPARVSET